MAARFIHNVLFRKLAYNLKETDDSNLKRCMGLLDLTSLGLGSTLGVGVYLLIGAVAIKYSGPSIVISFVIAALASIFAGLCYGEFGARVPKAGSTYVYTYVTIGELVAFIIGWNVLLEGFFGTASVAKGLSTYFDSMLDGVVTAWFIKTFPIHVAWFGKYFDLMAFCLIILLGIILAIGARKSTDVNNVFCTLNIGVILFVVVAGSFTAKVSNWSIPPSEVPEGKGSGGFFPYGWWGTMQGAAMCFYGFTGFEAISSTGEEVRDPRKTIPRAIIIALSIVLLVYVSVSTVITMMMPYYMLAIGRQPVTIAIKTTIAKTPLKYLSRRGDNDRFLTALPTPQEIKA
ncbi:amino acid permease domain-containing protein [Phthorimaea operculella]|nr:amino acid permease domain-containing protein [Phthorimaea operculella]